MFEPTATSLYSPTLIITMAALATYASRALGTYFSGKVARQSALIEWVTCVTYALLAGLVARMILLPIGALSATPDWVRLSAAGAGLAVFIVTRKNVGLGVLAGSLAIIALVEWNGF